MGMSRTNLLCVAGILTLLLTGCTSRMIVKYDDQGRVCEVVGKGSQEASMKQGDVEAKMNTKFEPIKDFVNIQAMRGS